MAATLLPATFQEVADRIVRACLELPPKEQWLDEVYVIPNGSSEFFNILLGRNDESTLKELHETSSVLVYFSNTCLIF